jgi:hypothetical protein
MKTPELLSEIKTRLTKAHGLRLLGVVLFGSAARGQSTPQSDVDLLVLLADPVDYGRDLETNLAALYPLALQIGRRISAKPVSAREYEMIDCPLYRAAHQEGIAA